MSRSTRWPTRRSCSTASPDKISTSFTINGTAAILLAFYVAAAEKKGVPREKLTGTIQNDILKEYASAAPGSGRRSRRCG